MTDYDKKEEKVLDKIAKEVVRLDDTLSKLVDTESDEKKHTIKIWFEEKKSNHELKKILHEAGKYADYDEKEMDEIQKAYDSFFD